MTGQYAYGHQRSKKGFSGILITKANKYFTKRILVRWGGEGQRGKGRLYKSLKAITTRYVFVLLHNDSSLCIKFSLRIVIALEILELLPLYHMGPLLLVIDIALGTIELLSLLIVIV